MQLSENRSPNPNLIQSANHQQCIIGANTHQQGIVIPSTGEVTGHDLAAVEALTEAHIQNLCLQEPELIILGTGQHITYPNPDLLGPLLDAQIGLEVLSNAAAARTFNVLLAENRRVVCMMFFDT